MYAVNKLPQKQTEQQIFLLPGTAMDSIFYLSQKKNLYPPLSNNRLGEPSQADADMLMRSGVSLRPDLEKSQADFELPVFSLITCTENYHTETSNTGGDSLTRRLSSMLS
jgi:hypothetical protein